MLLKIKTSNENAFGVEVEKGALVKDLKLKITEFFQKEQKEQTNPEDQRCDLYLTIR